MAILAADTMIAYLSLYLALRLGMGPAGARPVAEPVVVIGAVALATPVILILFRLSRIERTALESWALLRIASAALGLAGVLTAAGVLLQIPMPHLPAFVFGISFFAGAVLVHGALWPGLVVFSGHRGGGARRGRLPHRANKLRELGEQGRALASLVGTGALNVGPDLRGMDLQAVLERDTVDLADPAIAQAYSGRAVMVTGAGGMIGAELCRQLIACHPTRIVLFDQDECALAAIHRDVQPLAAAAGIGLVARLGSVTNRRRVDRVLAEEAVDVVLHAAARTDVAMMDDNEIEGARTNVLGARTMALAAQAARVERFVLVSTDKAVRATNLVAATMRLAELVILDLATRAGPTKFSIVRFGNALGASGSILALFRRQIEAGGPVTVADPEITRSVMPVCEAARLVVLAGSYARGGDVFMLARGKPVRIVDVARRMIRLSGRRVYDPETGEGDIRIEMVGLRPGEPRHEDLGIDVATLEETPHPHIRRADEHALSEIEVKAVLRDIATAIDRQDSAYLRRLIESRVEGYPRHPGHAAGSV